MRRREMQRAAIGADGPGDPLDSIRIAVRFDAPACSHCTCFHRELAHPNAPRPRCCDCNAANELYPERH